MNYWHIQMNQPWGRNSIKIDPLQMLRETIPVIGTGDWDDEQCRNFTDEKGTGMKVGDIVMVRDGKDPIALCEVRSESFKDSILEAKYKNQNYRKVKVLGKKNTAVSNLLKEKLLKFNSSYIQASGTLTKCVNNNATTEFINDWFKLFTINEKMKKNTDLLHYKKQIILQGPPGTGKTRLAKNIFYNILDTELKKEIDELYFREILAPGFQFSFKNGTLAKISKIVSEKLVLDIKNQGEEVSFTYQEVYDCFKDNDFLEKDFVDYNRYAVRSIVSHILRKLKHNKIEKQFKLIQFHPSYTYEDFVRGIVSKPNSEGDGIVYEAENKTLTAFAQAALINYKETTQKIPVSLGADVFEAFIENVKDEMALDVNHKYPITDAVYLFAADEIRFKYRGDNWVAHQKGLNMKFSELKQIIEANITERQAIKKMTGSEELTRQHATYFLKVAERFYEFRAHYKAVQNKSAAITLKNYVLVIDEINRANLSSVLGELIYALEYRGEEVESMYELDGSQKLILPPNLYIIGTMNTADRSVGHIDYAIRRRFAFVDVLPEELHDDKIIFQKELFKKVSALFINNYEAYIADKNTKLERAKTLSAEFRPEDLWLGHSYFIQTKEKDKDGKEILVPEDFNIRLEYEIKPILMEYVKDGILINTIKVGESEIKVEDYIKSL